MTSICALAWQRTQPTTSKPSMRRRTWAGCITRPSSISPAPAPARPCWKPSATSHCLTHQPRPTCLTWPSPLTPTKRPVDRANYSSTFPRWCNLTSRPESRGWCAACSKRCLTIRLQATESSRCTASAAAHPIAMRAATWQAHSGSMACGWTMHRSTRGRMTYS